MSYIDPLKMGQASKASIRLITVVDTETRFKTSQVKLTPESVSVAATCSLQKRSESPNCEFRPRYAVN